MIIHRGSVAKVTETEEVKEGCDRGTNQEKRCDEEGISCGGGVDDHPPETTKAEDLTKRHLARPWRSCFLGAMI